MKEERRQTKLGNKVNSKNVWEISKQKQQLLNNKKCISKENNVHQKEKKREKKMAKLKPNKLLSELELKRRGTEEEV